MKILALIIVGVMALGSAASPAVVVNEVLANEPGTESSLEWIELYNPGADAAYFSFYELRVYSGTGSALVPLGGAIAGGAYMILSRDVVRFEQHWGDSSGVWGDAAIENYRLQEASFELNNSGGRVALTYVPPSTISELAWTEPGRDGYSWERVYYTSNQIGQSVDPTGSTPGRINSLTPMQIDLALEGVEMFWEGGQTTIAFRIVNRGLTDIANPILELYKFDASRADSLGEVVSGESIGPVDSGQTVLLVGRWSFERYYQRLVASIPLPADQRPANNRLTFTAPGEQYPPVVLSEFLPAPKPDSASEWVELKNVSDSTFDLAGWQLGDATGLAVMATSEQHINPLEYLVLAEDSSAFRRTYPTFAGTLHQPSTWRTLNNGSDSVRMFDVFNIEADKFYYAKTFDSNYTWAKSEAPETEGEWGRSDDAGGTPGEANRVRLTPEGSRTLTIEIDPRIISPDGDGRDDSAVIRIQASEAKSYTLRLYDSQGRIVRTLDEDVPDLKEYYVWRGESDGRERVPIGIYILYVEAAGVESAKKTIVVAR